MLKKYPFRALGPNVLVLVDKPEETTSQGLIIHTTTSSYESEKKFQNTGVVIEIGPLAFKYSDGFHPWCKIGDRLSFGKYEGDFLLGPDGEAYRMLSDNKCGIGVNTIRSV